MQRTLSTCAAIIILFALESGANASQSADLVLTSAPGQPQNEMFGTVRGRITGGSVVGADVYNAPKHFQKHQEALDWVKQLSKEQLYELGRAIGNQRGIQAPRETGTGAALMSGLSNVYNMPGNDAVANFLRGFARTQYGSAFDNPAAQNPWTIAIDNYQKWLTYAGTLATSAREAALVQARQRGDTATRIAEIESELAAQPSIMAEFNSRGSQGNEPAIVRGSLAKDYNRIIKYLIPMVIEINEARRVQAAAPVGNNNNNLGPVEQALQEIVAPQPPAQLRVAEPVVVDVALARRTAASRIERIEGTDPLDVMEGGFGNLLVNAEGLDPQYDDAVEAMVYIEPTTQTRYVLAEDGSHYIRLQ